MRCRSRTTTAGIPGAGAGPGAGPGADFGTELSALGPWGLGGLRARQSCDGDGDPEMKSDSEPLQMCLSIEGPAVRSGKCKVEATGTGSFIAKSDSKLCQPSSRESKIPGRVPPNWLNWNLLECSQQSLAINFPESPTFLSAMQSGSTLASSGQETGTRLTPIRSSSFRLLGAGMQSSSCPIACGRLCAVEVQMKEVIYGDSDPANHLIVETRAWQAGSWAVGPHASGPTPATKGPNRVIKKQMGGVNSPMNGRVARKTKSLERHFGEALHLRNPANIPIDSSQAFSSSFLR